MDAIDAMGEQDIPDAVSDRLDWLSSADSKAAMELLQEVSKREALIATETLETELDRLIGIANQHHDKVVFGNRVVDLPFVTITINVTQVATYSRGRSSMMPDEPTPQNELTKATNPEGTPLSRIENPNDLLGEALRQMSPKKQEQIIGKAADEAVRLQVKQKEGEIDRVMATGKLDDAVDAAERLGKTGQQFSIEAEHKSEHGKVSVTVRNKPETVTKTEITHKGNCFVATVCFGSDAHPTVRSLRAFRDACLQESLRGRQFIGWYYNRGPRIADWISTKHTFQKFARVGLAMIACVVLCLPRVRALAQRLDDQIPR